MDYMQSKLFLNSDNSVVDLKLKSSDNYYNTLRKKVDSGYTPIIIPSDLMITILKKYFSAKKARIVKIELLEEDTNYTEQLDELIESLLDSRDNFVYLTDELSFLSEKSNVEIKKIRFKFREKELVDISLSVNGMLSYRNNSTTIDIIDNIKDDVFEYLS